ncbi:MAG TPA: chemotaxis protein CheB [Nitrospira sp.]|nr:chemotaxis protein CheB [Nitrospira sp.]
MAHPVLRPAVTNVEERLRRHGEGPEHTGRPTETPLDNLIVIGASAGGHKALREVVRELSIDIPAAVIIMQHLPPTDSSVSAFAFADWVQESTRMPVAKILPGDWLRSGVLYVAAPGTAVSLNGRQLHQVPYQRGSARATTIDTLFASAAEAYRDRVIGVILTGLLNDGTKGLKAVHEAGGLTIVQDPQEAEFPQMPASAMKDLAVTFCLCLRDIGPTLDLLARRRANLETGLAVSIRMLKERVALLVRLIAQSKRNPVASRFLSAEVMALEGDLRSIQALLDQAQSEEAGRRRSEKRRRKR